MPTPTYTALATVTLGSSVDTVSFSNIPATPYRDLILVISGKVGSTASVNIRFNDDSGSNYFSVRAVGTGATSVSDVQNSTTSVVQVSGIATDETTLVFNLMDINATDKHKTLLVRSGGASSAVWMGAGRWANTGRITKVTAILSTSTYVSGATLSLYGIEA
jgi:hypothetical protein